MAAQVIGAFFASFCFSLPLRVPGKYLAHCGITGAVGWLVYLLILERGFAVLMAAFFSAVVIALFSHVFARVLKSPVTVFLVPGLLPLVPGASIYRSVYYLIQNQGSLSSYYLSETLQISGAIAVAVFLVDTLFRLVKKK